MGWDGVDEFVVGHDDVRHTEELLAVSVARMYYIIVMRSFLLTE
jgi:hypothetical protein